MTLPDTPPARSVEPAVIAPGEEHFLSRSFLQSGGIADLVARAAPDQRVLSDAERAESLHAILAQRSPGDAWLFGYGSLIWNPTVHSVERRVARIRGWHRSFCLSVRVGRGSPDKRGFTGLRCAGLRSRASACPGYGVAGKGLTAVAAYHRAFHRRSARHANANRNCRFPRRRVSTKPLHG